ncbi:MAG: Lrp/AsnC family transcriptional regulator [Rhizobiaceae bacterium]|nr:Lrp/AsnC family transcriptional regulator [Rhizobiaceae bacterium]
MTSIDEFDLKILRQVQKDAAQPIEVVADQAGLSRNACWRRIKRLEADGFITSRVALLDAEKLDLDLMVYVMVRTHDHEPGWLEKFRNAVRSMPEIVGAHRMSGDLDYVLRVRVKDVKAYDAFYQRLIAKVPISEVSASFVMEDIKDTTGLPI